jgi:hypothetical protein
MELSNVSSDGVEGTLTGYLLGEANPRAMSTKRWALTAQRSWKSPISLSPERMKFIKGNRWGHLDMDECCILDMKNISGQQIFVERWWTVLIKFGTEWTLN